MTLNYTLKRNPFQKTLLMHDHCSVQHVTEPYGIEPEFGLH